MGLATDALNRLGQTPEQTRALLNAIPIAYAVTYIFGTIGSARFLAMVAPRLLRIDLVAECKAYEAGMAGPPLLGGEGSAWHDYAVRAYRIGATSPLVGQTVAQAEALLGPARVFRDGRVGPETLAVSPAATLLEPTAGASTPADLEHCRRRDHASLPGNFRRNLSCREAPLAGFCR